MKIVGIGLFILLFWACTDTPSEINTVDWRIIYREVDDYKREEMMIFIQVSDADSDEDPNEITVIAKDTGYKWIFMRDEWMPVNVDGNELWGMPAIVPVRTNRLPDTLYTLTLTDLAGNTTETRFRPNPDRPVIDKIEWPQVSVDNGILSYTGEYTNSILILRDENLQAIKSFPAVDGFTIPDLGAYWWEFWVSIGEFNSGVRIGPNALATPSE